MVRKQNNSELEFEIILVLLRGECHLRGIAKQLNVSHSTVLRKLNRLVEENVLNYKKEGKNKTFFIKKSLQTKSYVLSAERYKLNKLLKNYPKLNIIIEDVLKKSKWQLIVVFGSYAKFTAKKDSDIDIYIETNDRKEKERIELINSKINIKIGGFDLNSLLIKEIIKNHIILRGEENFYEKIKFFE